MRGPSCDLGFDADLVVRAARGELGPDESLVREHLKRCDVCGARLLAISTTKQIWSDLTSEPPAVARVRDARSLVVAHSRSRADGKRSLGTFLGGAVLGGLVVAAGALLLVGRGAPAAHDPAASGNVASTVATATASVTSPSPSPSPSSDPYAPPRALHAAAPAFVVKRASASCQSSEGELTPGATLPDRAAIDVPRGGTLLVAFSLAEALAEPERGLTVEGPARAVVAGEALGVERGRASLVTGPAATVRTPEVVVVASRGRLAIDADEGGTRIAVSSGTARITTTSGETRALGTGDRISVDPAGHVSAPRTVTSAEPVPAPLVPASSGASSVSSVSSTPSDRWASAVRALDGGDRSGAERELRQLLREVDATRPLYRRASFMLAELELARGSSVEARPRLEVILRGPEEQLAEDAATVLARSYPTPGERALVWSKYLGTSPPSPRRERALLERVRALVASGADGRAAAEACETSTPACAEARSVAGLKPR